MNHGFRKFFDSVCTSSGMNPVYVEFCEGHSLAGVKDSYFLPQPDSNGIYTDILEGNDKSPGYIAAINALTINESNRLRIQNQKLQAEKSEIKVLQEQVTRVWDIFSKLVVGVRTAPDKQQANELIDKVMFRPNPDDPNGVLAPKFPDDKEASN